MLSAAGAAKANELAKAKHDKIEVFMLDESSVFEGLGKKQW